MAIHQGGLLAFWLPCESAATLAWPAGILEAAVAAAAMGAASALGAGGKGGEEAGRLAGWLQASRCELAAQWVRVPGRMPQWFLSLLLSPVPGGGGGGDFAGMVEPLAWESSIQVKGASVSRPINSELSAPSLAMCSGACPKS